jgi:hypothetical protein
MTNEQRVSLRLAILRAESERLAHTLRCTVARPNIRADDPRERQGTDPWQTRASTGQDADLALDRRPLIQRTR